MSATERNGVLVVWGILWRSENRLDGKVRHIMRHGPVPYTFNTRREARDFIEEMYGYIAKRSDLRREPHGWRKPLPVRLRIEVL